MTETHVVIMAGGVGSRLFPISTPEHPKQFIDLLGCGSTLIQLTYQRYLEAVPDAEFWVVTSRNYIHFVREQLPQIPEDHILAEPEPRNTAPCIAYACWKIRACHPEAVMVVTPADAFVPDNAAFAVTLRCAVEGLDSKDRIVCIGIEPTEPHTGYGYIHSPGAVADTLAKVSAFKEKPSREVAEAYLAAGGYFWNAGIFVWKASTVESELRLHAPQIAGVMDALAPYFYTEGESGALDRLFPTCDKISIDYAVMEKSPDVYVVPGDWEWTDLGSFEAVERHKKK